MDSDTARQINETPEIPKMKVRPKRSDYQQMMHDIDPESDKQLTTMMKTVYHAADTRGYANHGWLEARHSFSFASYYDHDRIHFGALRVLNDDRIAGGMGFGTHPHDNMEIITIPLEGALAHKDSMGNGTTIYAGDIQVMSAGTGIMHSEFNALKDQDTRLLQIWVFPNKQGVTPRYDQITLDQQAMHNQWLQIVSPDPDDAGVWIHQQAWFSLGNFDGGTGSTYRMHHPNSGLYVFVLEGKVLIQDQVLNRRDGLGITGTDQINFQFEADSRVLLMEVPMIF